MRMDRLIEDLLDVTRLDAGERLSVAPETVAIDGALADAVAEHRAALQACGRTLEIDAGAAPPSVWVDRTRLLQVLDNLLGNAMKFARRSFSAREPRDLRPRRARPAARVIFSRAVKRAANLSGGDALRHRSTGLGNAIDLGRARPPAAWRRAVSSRGRRA